MITESSLHTFFDALPIGIWRQSADKKFAWANSAFCRIAGYRLDELQRMETFDLVKPSWRKFVMDRNKAILKGEVEGPYYFPTRTNDKEELIVMGTIGTLGDAFYGGYIAPIYIDQERDSVSGLLNEIVFYRLLRENVAACYRGNRPPFTLMALSVDRYKELLSSAGHLAIDHLLRRIGAKITSLTDDRCRSARIVDGLFSILFPEPIDTRYRILAQKLIDQVREEEGQALGMATTLSIAVVEYNENTHAKMDRKLISHAYRAMYRIQSAGGNALAYAPDP
jgi:diguanylate cyclase (GGDEF)-like protein/PAS domain S-box-containing protein